MKREANANILWVTWEKQIRNRSMSRQLEIPLFEIISSRGRLSRYASCIIRTISVIIREKPSILVCQNPSLVLSLFLLKIRSLLGFKVAIDAHYGGIEAYNGSGILQRVLDHCNRSADLVIATNETHAEKINGLKGRVFVCPDPLPDLSKYSQQADNVPGKVFFICSFDQDEPFREVFRAAETLLSEGFRFFVSGNYRKAGITGKEFPHVQLLGFVPEAEFYKHLFSSEIVIDLTENDNCLVCGAYEGLEAGKPLVLSNKKALKEYFTGGTVFTENRAEDIVAAVRHAHTERYRLAEDCRQWVSKTRDEMNGRIAKLKSLLEDL